ncbi:MFS transporter [Verminephrobacter eiseniae]|nr:MFS transporter [Verminephrobacter eiseniae]MCW8184875.1 MFS transporter [Verminephrobacter eiseniae]MCW8223621.1 MFS transporter [Verminephrobacter eiseniae]MCW8234669.1 MFS transporter [Verminephrobacter eiseniae]
MARLVRGARASLGGRLSCGHWWYCSFPQQHSCVALERASHRHGAADWHHLPGARGATGRRHRHRQRRRDPRLVRITVRVDHPCCASPCGTVERSFISRRATAGGAVSRFLLATLSYRLANGLLFLSVAWNLVRGSDNGAMSLAISSVGGLLPAVLIAPFAKRWIERADSRTLTLTGIALLLVLSLLFVPFLQQPVAVLGINFALLLVFFLLEGAWDTLLATIAVQLPQGQSDALNAHQSAATQAGLMLGGLPLGLLIRLGGPALSFYVCALLYAIAIALLLLPPRLARQVLGATVANTTDIATLSPSVAPHGSATPWHVLVTLAMVWPCLTLVNMALPLLAHAYGNGTVEHAALLDAMIGLGMAFAGLAYGVFGRMTARQRQGVVLTCAAFIPLPFLLLQIAGYLLWPLAACFFFSGVGFGLCRVSVRKALIATQPAHRVGQIVFSCNAYGFPVLTVGALLYALSWASGPVVPLIAFAVFAFAGGCTMLATCDAQRQIEVPVQATTT